MHKAGKIYRSFTLRARIALLRTFYLTRLIKRNHLVGQITKEKKTNDWTQENAYQKSLNDAIVVNHLVGHIA